MKVEAVADDVKIMGDKFTLMDLPYDRKDLEPFMSRETLDFHYGKHHKTYVATLNKLIKENNLTNKPKQLAKAKVLLCLCIYIYIYIYI